MALLWKHPQSKYWMARFIDSSGTRRNRSTRVLATDRNRKEAQGIAEQFEDVATKKRSSAHVRKVISELHKEITGGNLVTMTLRQHVESWLGRKAKETAPSTVEFYTKGTAKLLNFLGEKADSEIHDIEKADLIRFRDSLELAPKTVNHQVKLVRMIFADAKREELISDNPAEFLATLKGSRTKQKARRPFTVAELKAVLDQADEEWASMILCALYTGQRLGDVAGLRWSDFDRKPGREGMLRMTTGKTGRQIAIPIAGPLEKNLASLPIPLSPDDFLHPRAAKILAGGGKAGHLSNQFTDLLAKAGLRDYRSHKKKEEGTEREKSPLTFHSIRGTATSFLHEAGVPAAVAQEIIGHDSPEIHRHYTTMGESILRDSINKLPDLG